MSGYLGAILNNCERNYSGLGIDSPLTSILGFERI